MKYQDINFYIAGESKKISKQTGIILGRKEKTHLAEKDVPELYKYLNNSDDFTCFVFQLSGLDSTIESLIKAVFQKNPNFPIILFSSDEILVERYRYFMRLGVADMVVINKKKNSQALIDELMQVINIKSQSFLHTIKETEKILKATIVTTNHELNQPLTVILNAIGLLKAELSPKINKDSKIFSYINFVTKSINRIQEILENLRKLQKPKLKDYSLGVPMIDLTPEPSNLPKAKNVKINYKDTIILVEQNLTEIRLIENEIKKMGLEIIKAKSLNEAELYINKMVNKIHAVMFSGTLPASEVENTIYELNNRKDFIQVIIIKNDEISPENSKLIDSSNFQVLHKPINSKNLHAAIKNSVLIVN